MVSQRCCPESIVHTTRSVTFHAAPLRPAADHCVPGGSSFVQVRLTQIRHRYVYPVFRKCPAQLHCNQRFCCQLICL